MANFRAKTRAVELLGKGQIADLPTAITELWKNGYDAYAQKLECKLFLEGYKKNSTPIFLMSDDGFGMSENDLLEKWLVLGTDSKARGQHIAPYYNLRRRIPMGEKGIGRLSVSYLGSQMLMLTKKEDEKACAFLMDWRILDNYDFFLEDLFIPLYKFSTINEFIDEFSSAKKEFKINLKEENWKEQRTLYSTISNDLESINVPEFIVEDEIKKFCRKDFHGTSFIIFTPNDQILELSDKDRVLLKKDNSLSYLRASLSGLHNDLKSSKKDFETHFVIHDSAGKYDLIDEFFTQEEMRNADHWLKGEFDENGFFNGEIKIYNKREKYSFKPNRPPGKTPYGPFAIEWGALEGQPSATLLNEEQFRALNEKLSVFGSLYVYRDDFRVLPYGRPDTDFLEFEKRRNLGAGYYYFSHRRMIGYIDLKREQNPSLIDKAGREGFIQNKAYREFRDDLIEFFVDISKRYMRKTNDKEEATYREIQLKEINSKFDKQIAAVKRKNTKTKKAFLEQLKNSEDEIIILKDEITDLEMRLKDEAEKIEINYNTYNSLIEQLEIKKTKLRELKLVKPQGIKSTKKQENSYNEYQHHYSEALNSADNCFRIIENSRERINKENLKLEYNDKYKSHLKYLNKLFTSYVNILSDNLESLKDQIKVENATQIDQFISNSQNCSLGDSDDKVIIANKIKSLELLIEEQISTIDATFGGFIKHITNLQIDVDDDFLRSWYQEQNKNLEDRLSDYEELAQLGMAIEIIDHQFNVMYAQMNGAISEIKKQTQKHPHLDYSFKQLVTAFQHLEGNYKLLKPLYRTSRRTREIITGEQLEQYIKLFFEREFKRYNISFSVNDLFRDYEFFTYDSIIKPIFLNIINNANYWLIPVEKREIRINVVNDEIRIFNSGVKIEDVYLNDIFTLFFTRKKDGRGIGLYLAKKHLNSIGFDIYASNDKSINKLGGACFIIKKH